MDRSIFYRWLAAAEKPGADDAWELLAQYPALRDAVDPLGENALHKAAYCGSIGVAQMLLQAGIATQAVNECGQTALHLAVRGGQVRLVAPLTAAGIAIDAPDGARRTALFYAGSPRMVEELVRRGAGIRVTDAGNRNVLHAAVAGELPDRMPLVRALLQAGALATAKDGDGNTPLHLDASGDALWLLLGAGARVNMLNAAGQSALELAVRRGSENAVRILLNAGAAPAQGRIRDALEHICNPEPKVRRRIRALLEPHMVKMVVPETLPPPVPAAKEPETISLLPPRVLAARMNKPKPKR